MKSKQIYGGFKMEENKQRILDKIAKCLTLAKDQAGLPEGEAAAKRASEMMAKYRIAESEIDLSSKSSSDICEDKEGWEGLCDKGGKRQWICMLAGSLANTFDCQYWISPSNNTLHFIGTTGDIETCLYFMDVVYGHIERESRKLLPRLDQWRKRNVFGQAAEFEVSIRLRKMKEDMDKEIKKPEYSGGYDLIIVKNDLVKQAAKDIFEERGFISARSNFVQSTDAKIIRAGKEAGKTAPLNLAIE